MDIKLKELGGNTVELEIEVSGDRVADEASKIYQRLSRQASIPGFRKGKVPRNVIDKYFASTIMEDLADAILSSSYEEALNKHELRPISSPKIEIIQIDKQQPFKYKATVDLVPKIELIDYEPLLKAIEPPKAEVTPEMIDEALKNLADRNANLLPVEGRASENGDLVTLEFLAERPDGFSEDSFSIWCEEGGDFISEQAVGHSQEDTFSLSIDYPEEFPDEKLAGTTVKTPVKVIEIKEKQLPEIDDDFAIDLGEENLDELKRKIEDSLFRQAEDNVRSQSYVEFLEKVIEKTEIDLSEGFIERQACEMKSIDSLEELEEDPKELLEGTKHFFTRYFILRKLADGVGVSVTNDEIERIVEMQTKGNMQVQGEGEIYDRMLNLKLIDHFFPPSDVSEDVEEGETS